MSIETLKQTAAEKAVEQIDDGMILGLGSGSTVSYAIRKIGLRRQAGELRNIIGIPTSEETARLARKYEIPLGSLAEYPRLDLAIDGADEVDPILNLIKGLGGALLREKMVERTANHFIVVVDQTKLVDKLGKRGPLPIEVTKFGWRHQSNWLAESIGCNPILRGGEERPYVTDNGNYILDCHFPSGINNSSELAAALCARTGVVEHGLFLNMADEVIVAATDGVRVIK